MSRKETEEWFRTFVGDARWRFAKTYVESYPHEYTLDEWCDADAFEQAITCIERWGVVESFYSSRRKYFYVDERKYWHMGDLASNDPDDEPGLINRSWVDSSRYRAEALQLGYEAERLENLVERWKWLLAKARRG